VYNPYCHLISNKKRKGKRAETEAGYICTRNSLQPQMIGYAIPSRLKEEEEKKPTNSWDKKN
jgi:hypothetical protein